MSAIDDFAQRVLRETEVERIHIFDSTKPVRADIVTVIQTAVAAVVSTDVETREARWKLEQASRRDHAAQLELGRLLLDARSAWPARGRNAKGWGDFVAAVGISQDSALRYMALAKDAAKPVEISRSAGNPGVIELTKGFAKRVRAMLAEQHNAGFGTVIAAELRRLADEMEQAAHSAAEYSQAYAAATAQQEAA